MSSYTAWMIKQLGTRLACDHLTFYWFLTRRTSIFGIFIVHIDSYRPKLLISA